MKLCPRCKKWTLEFDEYFGRFRCFDSACGWMPQSSTERELELRRTRTRPQQLVKEDVPQLGTVSCAFDEYADALVFEFGITEPTFDLPEPDGRMIWKITTRSGCVAGFVISGATKIGELEVRVDFDAKKTDLETTLRRFPVELAMGRPSRVLIENLLTLTCEETLATPQLTGLTKVVSDAFGRLCTAGGK